MTLKTKVEGIPESLKELKQWVLWKMAQRNGQPTKVPFQISGVEAKSNDTGTWDSFAPVAMQYERGGYLGVGFEFSKDDGFCGIDLDGCRNPDTGEWEDWGREIIKRFNTYTEVSPSGTGAKLWCIGKNPFDSGKNRKQPHLTGHGGPAGVEMYDKGRYFAVTGHRLSGLPTEPQERQEAIDWFAVKFCEYGKKTESRQSRTEPSEITDRAAKYVAKIPGAVSGQGGHNDAFHVACVLVKGFSLSIADARSVFDQWNTTCQPPWSEREVEHKLAEAKKQPGENGYLVGVRENELHKVPVPIYKEQAEPKIAVTLEQATLDYIDKLESGEGRLIELGLGDIDRAIGGGIAPGEVVILAARPSHGKSMAAMQAAQNMSASGIPTCFMSEEMSKHALGQRSLLYASPLPQADWKGAEDRLRHDAKTHFENRADIHIVEACGTAHRVCEEIERLQHDKGVEVAFVDYIQLLSVKGNKDEFHRVTAAMMEMSKFARRTGITLVLLAQLSRGVEKRENFIPVASDLKNSGQLEQDADVIINMVWPHRIDPQQEPFLYQMFVGKNRNREIVRQMVSCKLVPSRQRIEAEFVMTETSSSPAQSWDQAEF